MKAILNILFEHRSLTKAQSREVLLNISKGSYSPAQVAAFMSVYLMRAITVEELSGFREAMLEMCHHIRFRSQETIDIVGTGGDGKDTFNISTLACFVTAGAGVQVTKHGNYGVSSVSGSSNVLECIGYKFTNNEDLLLKQLETAGLCFLHAPLFHPAMKTVAPVRKELGVRTFFNMLGPVVNPAEPRYHLLGVYNLEMARLYNYLFQSENKEYTIVHSFSGHDEVSLVSDFKMVRSNKELVVSPQALGLSGVKENELKGGRSVIESADIFMKILKGEGTNAQNDVVIANAALAIQCAKAHISLPDCIAMAKESLKSKKALSVYTKLIMN